MKDKAGETVIGASVVQKGNTGNGTITDIDGNYSLNVPSNSTLIFSYVGMTTQEVPVNGQTVVNFGRRCTSAGRSCGYRIRRR